MKKIKVSESETSTIPGNVGAIAAYNYWSNLAQYAHYGWVHQGSMATRVVKLLLIVIVIAIVMKWLWRESNSNSNRLLKIPE